MTYPEHIQWIINNKIKVLNKALSQDNSYKTIDNPLDVFLSADPTSKKKLTQWLVDTYINSEFRWEDIQSGSNSKVFDTLSLYVKHKSKLDSTNHIGQYDSLGSVYKDIAPFIKSDKSSRSVKRDDQAQAYEESEVLIKSDALTVVIPKTEYASKWWGRGTQWCTASDKNNMFERYYKDGPLIIIIINGVKTQLFINSRGSDYISFMDEYDNEVELKFVENNWTLLSPIIEWVVRQVGNTLEYVPKPLRTAELCLEAVRKSGNALYYVPEALRSPELCLDAVKQDGYALYYVPKLLITAELCLEAVKNYGKALEYVPEELITVELCLEAVRNNGLKYIPDYLMTEELCLEVVKQNGYALRYIPKHLRTEEICLEAVMQNERALFYVPDHLITEELCLEAVRKSGHALGDVPEALRTAELCLEAVRKTGSSLINVPRFLRTIELCLEAVRQDGRALVYVPDHLKNEEIYLQALRQDGNTLRDINKDLIITELCLEAVKQNSRALCHVPEDLRTAEILLYCESSSADKITGKVWDINLITELKLQLESIHNPEVDKITL